jgi:hypothetical protein
LRLVEVGFKVSDADIVRVASAKKLGAMWFLTANAMQSILEKFEFFPIKCRVQRSLDIFKIAQDNTIIHNKIFRIKVQSSDLCIIFGLQSKPLGRARCMFSLLNTPCSNFWQLLIHCCF